MDNLFNKIFLLTSQIALKQIAVFSDSLVMWNYLLNNSFKLFVNLNCRKWVCFWFDIKLHRTCFCELTGVMLPSLAFICLHIDPWSLGSFSSGTASQKGAKSAFLAPSPNSWPFCFVALCQCRDKILLQHFSGVMQKASCLKGCLFFQPFHLLWQKRNLPCPSLCLLSVLLCKSLCSHSCIIPVHLWSPSSTPLLLLWIIGEVSETLEDQILVCIGFGCLDTLIWWFWRKHLNKKAFLPHQLS